MRLTVFQVDVHDGQTLIAPSTGCVLSAVAYLCRQVSGPKKSAEGGSRGTLEAHARGGARRVLAAFPLQPCGAERIPAPTKNPGDDGGPSNKRGLASVTCLFSYSASKPQPPALNINRSTNQPRVLQPTDRCATTHDTSLSLALYILCSCIYAFSFSPIDSPTGYPPPSCGTVCLCCSL